LDAPRIRAHLVESSERKRDEDIEAAGAAPTSAERERLRSAAEKADSARKARIDDLVESFVSLDARTETTPVFREMTRILSEEGVDAALAFVDKQRGDVLDRIQARAAAVHEQNRTDLQPLLKAAGLRAAKGQTDQARSGYQHLLSLEPMWPDALEAYGWFLIDQSVHSKFHRTVSAAFADSQEALADAQLLFSQDESRSKSQRLFCASLSECADVLTLRGRPGDTDQANGYYARCLEISDGLFKANPDSAEAARDVSVIRDKFGNFLSARGQPGDADKAYGFYTRGLEISDGLWKASPDSALAARDVSVVLNKLGDFLSARGRPGDAEQAYRYCSRSLEISDGLWKASPDSAEAARDVSVVLSKLGDIHSVRRQSGDFDKALRYYTRGLEIREALLKANPGSGQAARDVSVILNRLGDFHAARGQPGDADQSLRHLTRSLEISDGLLQANPDSGQAARDVSISLEKLGDLYGARGQPGDADLTLKDYTRSLGIRETLLKANPSSGQASRDVCVSLTKLGTFHTGRGQPGDAELALGYYTRSQEISETLLKANPDSGQAARDVTVGLDRLSGFYVARGQPGDADQALGNYTRSLEIRDGLLAANPYSGQAARDVCVGLDKLGTFIAVRGRPGDADQALGHFTRGLEIAEKLLAANPDSGQAARDVSVHLDRLGTFHAARAQPGDMDLALKYCTRSLEIRQALLKVNPDSSQAARDVSVSLSRLGAIRAARDQPAQPDSN
jgi:tetratricopeptide (TPR) repeat protein